MTEDEIIAELHELKETYDRIFEYLPSNEATDIDQQPKDMLQQENPKPNTNQQQNQQQQQPQNQKQGQPKDKSHSQNKLQSWNGKYRPKPPDSKIRPGFEGPKIIRTKRQQK